MHASYPRSAENYCSAELYIVSVLSYHTHEGYCRVLAWNHVYIQVDIRPNVVSGELV